MLSIAKFKSSKKSVGMSTLNNSVGITVAHNIFSCTGCGMEE